MLVQGVTSITKEPQKSRQSKKETRNSNLSVIFSCGSFSFPAFVRDLSLHELLYGTFKQSLSPGKALCPKVCSATCPPGTGRHQPPIVFCRKLCQPQNSGGFQGEAPSLSPPKDPVNSSSPPQVGDSPSQLGIPCAPDGFGCWTWVQAELCLSAPCNHLLPGQEVLGFLFLFY